MRFGNPLWLGALGLGALGLAALALASGPARAQDWTIPAPAWPVGDAELRLGAEAGGALFAPDQPGRSGAQASGLFRVLPELRRDYDSGLTLALSGAFAAADPLSRGRYDGDAIEKLAAEARTGLGTLEIGIADGAGYRLAVTPPSADPAVGLDDARTSFFRDPATGRAPGEMFALRTEVGASSNYAKFAYVSPLLFGVQVALSFAPGEGKQLPFLNAGPHVPGRQADIWEAALRYETDFDLGGNPLSVAAYGAVAEGRAEHKLPGQEGVSDLGAGLRADYPLTEEITVSLGGAFRQSNAHAFDVNQAWQAGTTRAQTVSAAIGGGAWTGSIAYGNGVASAAGTLPRLGLNGAEIQAGYQASPSILVSAGWQRQSYSRDKGLFFNGAQSLAMDAVFLHVNVKTTSD